MYMYNCDGYKSIKIRVLTQKHSCSINRSQYRSVLLHRVTLHCKYKKDDWMYGRGNLKELWDYKILGLQNWRTSYICTFKCWQTHTGLYIIDCTQFTFCSNLQEFLYPPWLTFAGVLPGLSCCGLCVLSAPTIIFCKMVIMERKNNRKKISLHAKWNN